MLPWRWLRRCVQMCGAALALAAPSVIDAQGDTVTLAPVVVTATRLPQPVDAVAAAVTVLYGTDLRARAVHTVGEALRTVPGALVAETGSYGGQTALFLRGGEADYVKVLVDGVPLNQPGGAIDLADLTTDNVERIEVVRGPGSVLYGSDAVTGVIQIFTRTGMGAPRVALEGAGGTYGASKVAAGVSGGAARVSYALRASRFAAAGLYPVNNQYTNTVVTGHVRATPDAHTTASLAYHWSDAVYHFPTDGAGQPVDSNQVAQERGPSVSLELARQLREDLELRLLGTWEESRVWFSDQPDSPGEDGAFTSRDLIRRAGVGAALHWRPGAGTVLSAGVDYDDERQHGRSLFDASYGTFPDSVALRRWTVGYYGQVLLGSGGPLGFTLGGRVDRNAAFGAHATVRAGVSYHLDGRTRVRAAVGTGFKEPTFYENFATGFVRGNPNLRPERSTSWEVGLEHAVPGDRVTLTVTYYDQRFRDLIEYTAAPPLPDSVNYFNVDGARVAGVEARLAAQLGAGIVATLTYDYLDTRVLVGSLDGGADGLFVAGRPLLRRPAHGVTPQLSVPVGQRGRLAVTVRWVGSRDDLDFSRDPGQRRVTLRPYARVGIGGEYRVPVSGPGGASFILTLRGDNLTNDDAQEVAGFRSLGRTLLVGGRLEFGR